MSTPPIERTTTVTCAGCGDEREAMRLRKSATTVIPMGWARLIVCIRGPVDPTNTQRRTVYACSPECGADALEDDFDRMAVRD